MWQHVEKLEEPNMIWCRSKAMENWTEVRARGAEMLNVMVHFNQWHTMSLCRRTRMWRVQTAGFRYVT